MRSPRKKRLSDSTVDETSIEGPPAPTKRLKTSAPGLFATPNIASMAYMTPPKLEDAVNFEVLNRIMLAVLPLSLEAALKEQEQRASYRNNIFGKLSEITKLTEISNTEKCAMSFALIENSFLQIYPLWFYRDVYESGQCVPVPINSFTPLVIFLAHQLSPTEATYLDDFLLLDESINLNHLVQMGMYLDTEIGLHLDNATGRLALNCGSDYHSSTIAQGISRPSPRANFKTMAHTHPTRSSFKDQFNADIRKDAEGLEIVITASELIVYFDQGLIHNATNGRRVLANLEYPDIPMLDINTPINAEMINQLEEIGLALLAETKAPAAAIAKDEDEDDFSPFSPGFSFTA